MATLRWIVASRDDGWPDAIYIPASNPEIRTPQKSEQLFNRLLAEVDQWEWATSRAGQVRFQVVAE